MTVRLSVVLRLAPCVNEPGIGAVRWRQCGAQAGVARHQNEVSMIGHGHPGPALDFSRPAGGRQQIAVKRVI